MRMSTILSAIACLFTITSIAAAMQGGLGTNHLPPKTAMPSIAFYVDAANGDDTQWAWHERLNDPTRSYLTVEAVMDALVAMEAEMVTPAQGLDRPVTVWFYEGTYELQQTIEIGPELSGDPSLGIWLTFAAIRSDPDDPATAEEVLFSGGERITIWNEGGCSGDRSTQGATKSKWWGTWVVDWPISDLWVSNERATVAREPDIGEGISGSGFARIDVSYVEESDPLTLGDRRYTIDHPLPLSFGEPCTAVSGYVEAVVISEWSVSRSLPDLCRSEFDLIDDTAELWFDRDIPLGKICGPAVGQAIDPCDSVLKNFYPAWYTVRGTTHIQNCPEPLPSVSPLVPHTIQSGGLGMGARDDRLFVEGAKGFMDERFEWYQRRVGSTGTEQINIRLPATDACVAEMDPRDDTIIIVPRLTKLVRIWDNDGDSTEREPIKGIVFCDIMFAHTNWTRPGVHYSGTYEPVTYTSRGVQQAGICHQGSPSGVGADGRNLPPAAFEVEFGEGIVVQGCKFAHLAANAINAYTPVIEFDHTASHTRPTENDIEDAGIMIRGNEFFDVGGTAIAIGRFGRYFIHSETVGGYIHSHVGPFSVNNNLIHNPSVLTDHSVGVRTISSAGIWASITQNAYIWQNEISETPDSGIFGGAPNDGVYDVEDFICDQFSTAGTRCGLEYFTRSSGEGYAYRGLQGDFFVTRNRLDKNMDLITDGASIYLRSSPGSARDGFDPDVDRTVGGPSIIIRSNMPEAVVQENYVTDVAPNGVTGGQNTVAGLYFDNCSANWKVLNNRFASAEDWMYVQVAVGAQSAFPASFSWGYNYFDLAYPLLNGARDQIELRLMTQGGCTDYDSVVPGGRYLSSFTGCPPYGVAGPCTGTNPFAVDIADDAGLDDLMWGYLRTDTSAKIHP